MTKIQTAEEVIFQKQITAKHPNFTIEEISEMMKEYTNQFIDLAAEDIKNDIKETITQVNWAPDCEYKEGVKKATNFALQIVDESILKLKERVV